MTGSPAATERSAPTDACLNERVDRERAPTLRVRDAMTPRPKTLAADATVGMLRATFENPHVAIALLADAERFAGAIARDQVHDSLADDAPARTLVSRRIPTIEPDAPLTDALAVLDARGETRLVVVEGERLVGLLCLTRDRLGFCQS